MKPVITSSKLDPMTRPTTKSVSVPSPVAGENGPGALIGPGAAL